MFKNLSDILTTDCEVYEFKKNTFFYPIFKNGRSSLQIFAQKKKLKLYKNEELRNLKKIKIFLRSPQERFVSGVWTYFYFTNNHILDETILKKIENFKIIDKHFVPQYIWIFHLYKYFKGLIEIVSVDELLKLIPNRDGPWYRNPLPWKNITLLEKNKILSLEHKKYIEIDKKIIKKYMNKTFEIEEIIKEFKI